MERAPFSTRVGLAHRFGDLWEDATGYPQIATFRLVVALLIVGGCTAMPTGAPGAFRADGKTARTEPGPLAAASPGSNEHAVELQARVEEDWTAYGLPEAATRYADLSGAGAESVEACVLEYSLAGATAGAIGGAIGSALGCGGATLVALASGPGAIVVGGSCAVTVPEAAAGGGLLGGAAGRLYGRLRCSDEFQKQILETGLWLVSHGFRLFGATVEDEQAVRGDLEEWSLDRMYAVLTGDDSSRTPSGGLRPDASAASILAYNAPSTRARESPNKPGLYRLYGTIPSNCGRPGSLCCDGEIWSKSFMRSVSPSSLGRRLFGISPQSYAFLRDAYCPRNESAGYYHEGDQGLRPIGREILLVLARTAGVTAEVDDEFLLSGMHDANGQKADLLCICDG